MQSHPRGFTLIEMIVSVAIFAIVMTAFAGAYLNLINIDRQTRALADVADNLSFSIDSMSRAIRTGTNYECSVGVSPCSEFTFVNSSGQTITYLWNSSTREIGQCTGALCTPSSATYFTDPRINVGSLMFYVNSGTATQQPTALFVVHGTINTSGNGGGTNSVAFTIQTMATQRAITP